MKKAIVISIILLILAGAAVFFYLKFKKQATEGMPMPPTPKTVTISDFAGCAAAGYPVMESYPRRCVTPDGKSFTEEVSPKIPEKPVVKSDEHGCAMTDGYSWCELKGKCLRIAEEACSLSTAQEIQAVLAKLHKKTEGEVEVTINKQDGGFASGNVMFKSGEGGMFLAAKIDGVWQIPYEGNGMVDCKKLRQQYKFPDTILKPNFCE